MFWNKNENKIINIDQTNQLYRGSSNSDISYNDIKPNSIIKFDGVAEILSERKFLPLTKDDVKCVAVIK